MSRSSRSVSPVDGNRIWFDDAAALAALRKAGVAADEIEPRYRRVRMDGSSIHAFVIHGTGPSGKRLALEGYVRTFADPARQAEVEHKASRIKIRETPLGEGLRRVGDGSAILLLFPNDLALRELFQLTDADKLKRLLAGVPGLVGPTERVRGRRLRVTPMRYKPEHRYVARLDLEFRDDANGGARSRAIFVRYFTDDRGASLARCAELLRANGFDRFPECVGTMLEGTVHLEEAIEGRGLLDVIGTESGAAADVGRMIAALHREASPRPQGVLPRREAWPSRAERATRALRSAGILEDGEEASWLADIACLTRAVPEFVARPVILHGDLHVHQVLLASDGPVLVDFERCAMGDPLDDIGNLLADLSSRDDDPRVPVWAEEFLDAYQAIMGPSDTERLAVFKSCAHLERALMALRRASRDAEALARAEVARAADSLRDRARADVESTSANESSEATIVHALPGSLPWPWATESEIGCWEAVFPSSRGPWTARFRQECGGLRHATFEPAGGELALAAPVEDRALPGLAERTRDAEIVAYRPGKRCVLRSTDGPTELWIKIVPPKRAPKFDQRLRAVEDAASACAREACFPRRARVRERDVDAGVFVFDPMPGTSLYDHLTMRGESRRCGQQLERIATALAAFQADAAAEAARKGGIESEPRGAAIADAYRWRDHVAHVDRCLALELTGVLDSVSRLLDAEGSAAESRLVHGDLHDKNILLTSNGSVGFLDLDSVRLGDPAFDPGNLAAHFVLRSLQESGEATSGRALLDDWFEAWAAVCDVAESRPRCFAASTLARLTGVYRLRRQYAGLAPRLLDEASRILENRP